MREEKCFYSASGVPVYLYGNPALHGFYISLFLREGSMYEAAEESGITHFFEHIAIRNLNKTLGGELYRRLDRLGLELNASTYCEMVQFYVSGAAENFYAGAQLLTSVLSPIVLSPSEITLERKRIKAEIREGDERTSLTAFTNSHLFGSTALSRPITGTLGSVSKIGKRELTAFRERALTSENLFFYVTGNAGERETEKLIECIDGINIPRGAGRDNFAPVTPDFSKRGGGVYIKNADFTMCRFSFDTDMALLSVPELDLLYDLLLNGYNSRLFIALSEERGLFYDVNGLAERYRNIGHFSFSFEVKDKELYDACETVVSILRDIKERTVAPEEIIRAGYVTNSGMLYDDMRELNFTFAYDNHILGLGYGSIGERAEMYSSITPERLREAAQRLFTEDNLTLTLKADAKRVDAERLKKIISAL